MHWVWIRGAALQRFTAKDAFGEVTVSPRVGWRCCLDAMHIAPLGDGCARVFALSPAIRGSFRQIEPLDR